MAFQDWQCRLAGLDFGTGTPYRIFEFLAEKPTVRVQDTNMPAEDGIRMGRDYLSGTLVAISLGIEAPGPETVMDRLAALRGVWNGTARSTPGAVMELFYRRPGSAKRIVYGRPRRFTPASMGNVAAGYVPVETDFQAVDHRFYLDETRTLSISGDPIEYLNTAGTVTPHVPPVTLAEAVLPSDVATNGGDAATWPVITLHGPRDKPGVSYVGENRSVSLALVLGDGVSVTIDTRPWKRSVLRDDGASLAGALRGSRLSELALSPGDTQLAFDGRDSTLTSSVGITWRDAYGSL